MDDVRQEVRMICKVKNEEIQKVNVTAVSMIDDNNEIQVYMKSGMEGFMKIAL